MNRTVWHSTAQFISRALATIAVAAVVYWSVFAFASKSDDRDTIQSHSPPPIPVVQPLTQLTEGLWSFGDSPWRIGASEIDDHNAAVNRLMDASNLPQSVAGDPSQSDAVLDLVEQFNPVTEVLGAIKRRTVGVAGLQMAVFTGVDDDFRELRVLAGSQVPYLLITVSVPDSAASIIVDESPDQDWTLKMPSHVTEVGTRYDSSGRTIAKFLLTPQQPGLLIELWKRQGWSVDADQEIPNVWYLRQGQQLYSVTRGPSPDGQTSLIAMRFPQN